METPPPPPPVASTERPANDLDVEALEGILEDQEPHELLQTIRAVVERHSGPLPHPSILRGYKEVDPDCVPWILERARKEQDHRHWCERSPLDQARRGQLFAFVLGILVVLVGASLIYAEKPMAGFTAMFVPLASLLGIFVYREIRSSSRTPPPVRDEGTTGRQ